MKSKKLRTIKKFIRVLLDVYELLSEAVETGKKPDPEEFFKPLVKPAAKPQIEQEAAIGGDGQVELRPSNNDGYEKRGGCW